MDRKPGSWQVTSLSMIFCLNWVSGPIPRLKGRCFIIRYADDFIIGCETETDANRIMDVLPNRFGSYDLSLHPTKTASISFGRPSASTRKNKRNGTFDFLGFTFYWARSLKGYWIIKKKTSGKRINRFMKMLWQWTCAYRHDPVWEQYLTLTSKLLGFYQYYGVITNHKALETVFEYAEKACGAKIIFCKNIQSLGRHTVHYPVQGRIDCGLFPAGKFDIRVQVCFKQMLGNIFVHPHLGRAFGVNVWFLCCFNQLLNLHHNLIFRIIGTREHADTQAADVCGFCKSSIQKCCFVSIELL
jgi:hypothetical protein